LPLTVALRVDRPRAIPEGRSLAAGGRGAGGPAAAVAERRAAAGRGAPDVLAAAVIERGRSAAALLRRCPGRQDGERERGDDDRPGRIHALSLAGFASGSSRPSNSPSITGRGPSPRHAPNVQRSASASGVV
jgi:hypothetical protein